MRDVALRQSQRIRDAYDMPLTWDMMSEIAPVFTGLKEKATGLRVKMTYRTMNCVKRCICINSSANANENSC